MLKRNISFLLVVFTLLGILVTTAGCINPGGNNNTNGVEDAVPGTFDYATYEDATYDEYSYNKNLYYLNELNFLRLPQRR